MKLKQRNICKVVVLFSVCLVTVLSAAKPKPVKKQTGFIKKSVRRSAGLPPQPRTTKPALPDLTIEKFKFSGAPGPWDTGKKYGVGVVLKNIGQFESGDFMVKLQVRVQVPSVRKDQTDTVGTRRVSSVQPRKSSVSAGTSEVWFNYTTGNYDWAQYNFTATVDNTNHIEEFDEANNTKTSLDQTVDTNR